MSIRNSRGIADSPSSGMKNAVRLNMAPKNPSLLTSSVKLPEINSPKSSKFNKNSNTTANKSKFGKKVA